MAILSESEFESVLTNMLRKLEKMSFAQAGNRRIDEARRQLQSVLDFMLQRDDERPSPEQLAGLTAAAETIRSLSLGDAQLEEDSFDIEDYVTYRM